MRSNSQLQTAFSLENIVPLITPFDKEEQEEPNVVFKSIRLNPGISLTNFICGQMHYMLMIFTFGITDTLQPLILLDRTYYAINKDTAGTFIALILFIQLMVKVIVSVPYGHWSDKFGRKVILLYGLASIVTGLILAPCFLNVFPGFLIAKLFICNGCSAIGSLPLNADYIHDDSKGKVAGITVTLSAVGALGSNLFLKALLYSNYTLGDCYRISACIIAVAIILNSFGLKDAGYDVFNAILASRNQENASLVTVETKSFWDNFNETIAIFKENGWLSVALVLQILGNADFYLAFTILALYVKSLFPVGVDDKVANLVVNNVQTYLFIPSLISNLLYGWYIDKTNKTMLVIVWALSGGAIAFLMTSFVQTPYDSLLKISAFLIGMTMTGVYVASNYLCTKHYPKDKRGIMLGFTVLVGYMGYVIIVAGGGFLFDYWRKNAPFILYAILSLIALVWTIKIYRTRLCKPAGLYTLNIANA